MDLPAASRTLIADLGVEQDGIAGSRRCRARGDLVSFARLIDAGVGSEVRNSSDEARLDSDQEVATILREAVQPGGRPRFRLRGGDAYATSQTS